MINLLQSSPPIVTDITSPPSLAVKIKSMAVFEESGVYINGKRIFFAYHEILPNMILLKSIRYEKAIKWVEENYSNKIIHKHEKKHTLNKSKPGHCINAIYVMEDELMIDIENNGIVCILYTDKSEAEAESIEKQMRKFINSGKNTRSINLLTDSQFGLDLLPIKCKKPKLDLDLNYNDDLKEVHNHLLTSMNKKGKSGLVLLHGIPGTGKSTYIRYLIHSIKKKKVIFLPPKLASNLDSPAMTTMLVENPDSIIIIEDAEELIASREGKSDSSISMLLNLTDGMLGESLGVQVLCTFNTNVNNIDKALLRKGRLIASYEFKELQESKAKILFEKMGITSPVLIGDITLADIYNVDETGGEYVNSNKLKIGFVRG